MLRYTRPRDVRMSGGGACTALRSSPCWPNPRRQGELSHEPGRRGGATHAANGAFRAPVSAERGRRGMTTFTRTNTLPVQEGQGSVFVRVKVVIARLPLS